MSASFGAGSKAFELRPTETSIQVAELWRSKRLENRFQSSIYYDGFVYGLDNGTLVCLDASTGERRWKGGRYGYGQVLSAGDHLIVPGGDGEPGAVQLDPSRYIERARFQALGVGTTWNAPALADGRLLVRNSRQMARFDVRSPDPILEH